MWKCEACGACCKMPANKILMPHFWDEDKMQCMYLSEDNKCLIYDTRPDVCRVDNLWFTNGVQASDKLLTMSCELCRQYVRESREE